VSPRIQALVLVALVSAVLLITLAMTTGATFTAPTTNPSNQLATATLAAPTGVSAIVQANGGTVRIAWTATSSTWASGHRIYRATSAGGPYTLIQQIAGTATVSYDDVPGVGTFYYVVRGYYNPGGANWESIDSAQAIAKPLDHFGFNAIAAQHSGTAFSVMITAQAQDNSTVTGFTGTVTLATNSGTIAPTTSGAFVAGARTESVTITGPYKASETITVSGGTPSRGGTSGVFVLDHFRAAAIAINNKVGGVAGKPESGDTVTLTFNEAASIATLGACNGATTSASDLQTNDVNPDTMTALNTSLAFGTIDLGNNGYFTASKTAKNSTCTWNTSNTVLTITLQGVMSAATVAGASTAAWTPHMWMTSASGEAIDLTQIPTVTAVLF
jgi:hypothetical protein